MKYIPVPIVTSLLLSYQPPQFLVTQMSLLFAGEPADYSLVQFLLATILFLITPPKQP